MDTCPNCGAEVRHIPAGVSKMSGKPYDAFDSCAAKCGWKPSREAGVTKVVRQNPVESKIPSTSNGSHELSIFKCNAMNNATGIVSKRIEVGLNEEGTSGQQIITIYRDLMEEIKK